MTTSISVSASNSSGTPLDVDLSVAFARKYLQKVSASADQPSSEPDAAQWRRTEIAKGLLAALRSISARSWTKTEHLLAPEILRHGIDAELIDPWQVSGGVHRVYKCAIEAYTAQRSPFQLVSRVSPILGQTRQEVTAIDPRAISFVAMQYHYTGVQLMELLPKGEQENFAAYVKVLDDHLYMPLPRAYQAAAQHATDSIALGAVRLLMPRMTPIAERIVDRVAQLYPRYRSHTGQLSHPQVRTSSIRDVEMFQVYLWVCLLEGSLQAIQEELFPLCVMIYPRVNVSWELVRQMTYLLRKAVTAFLTPEQAKHCDPYYQVLERMFSSEVFPNQ